MTDWTHVDRIVHIFYGRWTEAKGMFPNGGGPVHMEGRE